MTEECFSAGIATLSAVFGEKPSETALEVYFNVLGFMPEDEFLLSVNNLLEKRVYRSFPLPAEIIAASRRNSSDMAMRALLYISDAVARNGRNNFPSFEDKTIPKAIECLGGWSKICAMSSKEFSYFKKDFIEFYVSISNNLDLYGLENQSHLKSIEST